MPVSKIEKILEELRIQGKISTLSDEVTERIRNDIHREMEAFRVDLAKKQAQSVDDLSRIILVTA